MGDRAKTEGEGRGVRRGIVALGWILAAMGWIVGVVVVAQAGLSERRRIYESTPRIRHGYDITHNLMWGMRAVDEGYYELYSNVISQTPSGNYLLDYVPLRLYVMSRWAAWARDAYPGNAELQVPNTVRTRTGWQPDYEFTRPLLMFSTWMEAISALVVFLLVRMWVRRSWAGEHQGLRRGPPEAIPFWRGGVVGAIAAAMLWLNPAVLLSAHVWPSSDIWIIPFFLLAILFGCHKEWFAAGAMIGLGTMFKGQQLMMVPLFILWPIFMGRPMAALRWFGGFIFAAAMIVSPWLLRDPTTRMLHPASAYWVGGVVLACVIALLGRWLIKRRWISGLVWAVFAGLMVWPWVGNGLSWRLVVVIVVVGLMVWLAWRTPAGDYLTLSAGLAGLAIAVCPLLFPSDLSWYQIGFQYGADKFPSVSQFPSSTLPALLARRFGWNSWTDPVFSVLGHPLTLKQTMVGLYGVCLTLAALAMAWHTRRNSRRFLVAICVPWMAAYTFMPQMHARYLLFPAAVGAVLVGVSVGLALLEVVLSGLAWLAILHLMYGVARGRSPLLDYLGPTLDGILEPMGYRSIPDSAWAVLLVTGILVYAALVPGDRARSSLPGQPQPGGT